MRILIYKRTHNGDPDSSGCFGVHDCMGAVRDYAFDAVIGIGGIGPDAQAQGIAGKINWIGIGPSKLNVGKRGPEVTFDHFLDYGTCGPDFRATAPNLAKRMYDRNIRILLHGFTVTEFAEATKIVGRAYRSRPSPKRSLSGFAHPAIGLCKPKCQPACTEPRDSGVVSIRVSLARGQ